MQVPMPRTARRPSVQQQQRPHHGRIEQRHEHRGTADILGALGQGWRSSDTRSTTASIAEFSSSTTITSSTLPIISARSSAESPSHSATGTAIRAIQTSWRKASSLRYAARRPSTE